MYPVTVIIPCFDEPALRLTRTVLSVLKAGADDVVVVDDGSDTPPVPPFAVRLVQQEHKGISAAINLGVTLAKHAHICWLGVGDLMHPDRLATQMAVDAPAQFHDYTNLVDGKDAIAATGWRSRLWYCNQFSLSTTMVTREVIDAVGGRDESLQYCHDWDFALRVELAYGWTRIGGVWTAAAQYPGGHSDRGQKDPRRRKDRVRVNKWARKHETEWAIARRAC